MNKTTKELRLIPRVLESMILEFSGLTKFWLEIDKLVIGEDGYFISPDLYLKLPDKTIKYQNKSGFFTKLKLKTGRKSFNATKLLMTTEYSWIKMVGVFDKYLLSSNGFVFSLKSSTFKKRTNRPTYHVYYRYHFIFMIEGERRILEKGTLDRMRIINERLPFFEHLYQKYLEFRYPNDYDDDYDDFPFSPNNYWRSNLPPSIYNISTNDDQNLLHYYIAFNLLH